MIITSINPGEHPASSVTQSEAASIASQRPEFFRLPTKGGDPFFGLTRAFYYIGEIRGYWKLTRIRARGKIRGITLVSYDAVAAFIHKQIEGGAK